MSTPTLTDIHAYMGDHTCSLNFLAQKCLIGAWASFMNLSRKGNAETLRLLGLRTFGERPFTTAHSHALLVVQAHPLAIDGFGGRIEVKNLMGLHIADDREMAKKCLVGGFACLIALQMAEVAEKVKAVGESVFGEKEWDEAFLVCVPAVVEETEKSGERRNAGSNETGEKESATFKAGLGKNNLARARAESWSYEVFAEEDHEPVKPKTTTLPVRTKKTARKAAAPAADHGKHCPRCGLPDKVVAALKEGGHTVDLNESAVEEHKVGDEVAKAGDAKTDKSKQVAGVDPSKVCDRCGSVDGANGVFWPFHILDPAGKN